jgi:alpha-glucosidase
MDRSLYLLATLILSGFMTMAQQTQSVQSPDGKIRIVVDIKEKIYYSVFHQSDPVITTSAISMTLQGGEVLGSNPKFKSAKTNSVNQLIQTPIYKRSKIEDKYNELVLNFSGDYSLTFRAYNDGAAYRFITSRKKDFLVENEEASFNFGTDHMAIVPYVNGSDKKSIDQQFTNSFENTYTHTNLSKLDSKRLAFLPLVVELANGKKVCITEADLENYPGMYLLNKDGKTSLSGVFAPYPKRVEQDGHNLLQLFVKERENYIAKAKGSRTFPWRVMVISSSDKELADNNMIYKLASPSRLTDYSWVKPGKVAWDWWNDWNIFGVDFKSGINTETYKYYIDFASANNIEYVIMDEGWAVNKKADLLQVIPEIDLKAIIDHGKQKNVGIILWAGYYAFERDMENVCKHYSEMGVKGFKIDFMDRDDQKTVEFYYKAAATTAKYHLMADFHGAYKPTGLNRTYPNVINFEGVHGLEQMKWAASSVDQVTYDVTIPFIRMLAGPMDYTPGAMRNSSKGNFRPVNSEPMSQGTRCRQLAEFVVFEAPFNMLSDNPSNYMKEAECTKFMAAVPTTWDNTIALDGKIAEFVAIARQKNNEWYLGALTNWDAREIELDLGFLGEGNFKVEIFRDGVNADRVGMDYKHETIEVPGNRKLKVQMAPGGGYVGRIYKQ